MNTKTLSHIQCDNLLSRLVNGEVVVISTQLGYAILAIEDQAIEKLYRLKGRPLAKPTGVLGNPEIFRELTNSSYLAAVSQFDYPVGVIEKFDSESLNISQKCVSDNSVAFFFNLDTNLTKLAKLAWKRKKLIVLSSANKSNKGNSYTLDQLHDDFKFEVDYFVDNTDLSSQVNRQVFENLTTTILDLVKMKTVRRGIFADRVIAQAWKNGLDIDNAFEKNKPNRRYAFSSCMFLLAHKERAYVQIKQAKEVDWFVLDLEDGCPLPLKPVGRLLIENYSDSDLYSNYKVAVRLNGLDEKEELLRDLNVIYSSDIKGFALPMLRSAKDVLEYDTLISQLEVKLGLKQGHFSFFPIIETAEGLTNAIEIANASERNKAMFLGHADLFSETQSERNPEILNQIRLSYLLAARSANLQAFDTPYENTWDLEGLRRDSMEAKNAGLQGKVALNINQVNIINEIFKTSSAKKEKINRILDKYTDGCEHIEGRFVAPPVVKRYKLELEKPDYIPQKLNAKGIKGKTMSYGLDYMNIHPGTVLSAPYETTIDESWITAWQALVQTGNPLETSVEFCHKLGLEKRLVPYHCLVNLGLCLAVESFSESSIFHLGISNVKYEKPVFVGDTIRTIMIVDKIKPSSNQKYSVFYTRMLLLNQHGEVVVRMNRNSLFPYMHPEDVPEYKEDNEHEFWPLFSLPSTNFQTNMLRNALSSDHYSFDLQPDFKAGELILHSIAKPIGLSNSLAFSTLCKNTHPLHINSARYGMDGLVVCGGFIVPMMHASASRDIRFALAQEIVDTMHINRIHHEDCIGAMTYVENVTVEDGIEELTLRTFGLKNIDAEKELKDLSIPIDLLASKHIKPSEIELLCDTYCPALSQRICARMTWKLWRKAN